MKTKSMTDLEISSFNATVDKLRTDIESLRNAYQVVEEGIEELKAAIDTIKIEGDDDIEENFELIRILYNICSGVEQALIDLEEAMDELDQVEENDDDDDE
jgi:methyl-accepting chemotaxis protein